MVVRGEGEFAASSTSAIKGEDCRLLQNPSLV